MRKHIRTLAVVVGLLALIAIGFMFLVVRSSLWKSAKGHQEPNLYTPTSPMLPPIWSVYGNIWVRDEDIPADPIDTEPQFVVIIDLEPVVVFADDHRMIAQIAIEIYPGL